MVMSEYHSTIKVGATALVGARLYFVENLIEQRNLYSVTRTLRRTDIQRERPRAVYDSTH